MFPSNQGLEELTSTVGSELQAPAFNEFPLAVGQERLWVFEQLCPGTSAYNMPEAWHLKGALDETAFEAALQDLTERHETLRTFFQGEKGIPVQRVLKKLRSSLVRVNCEDEADPKAAAISSIKELACVPIRIERGPLFKAFLFKIAAADHIVLFMFHHAICDEWSLHIFRRDFSAFYQGRLGISPELPNLAIQFADFAVWQRNHFSSKAVQADIGYWQSQLEGDLPFGTLPANRPRGGVLVYKGRTVFRTLPTPLAQKLQEFSRRHSVTLFVSLLAAFKATLHKWCRQEDLIVGIPLAGRERLETEDLIGFFVQTHAVRVQVREMDSFLDVLRKVRTASLNAQLHQSAPVESVVGRCQTNGAGRRHHPLFSVFFALQPALKNEFSLPNLTAERIELDNGGSKFELSILAREIPEGIQLRCEYSTELFEQWLVDSFLDSLEVLLREVIENPEKLLSKITLCSTSTREDLQRNSNGPKLVETPGTCIHEMFEAAAHKHPTKRALIADDRSLTYGELNALAERYAQHLRARSYRPNTPVAICLPRTSHLVISMLGILKAGGAYVPLDPAYPADRLKYMLEDSGAELLITSKSCPGVSNQSKSCIIFVEDLHQPGSELPSSVRPSCSPEDLAYVIYTSGSTGQPKGVALQHRGAAALIQWAKEVYSPAELAGVLAGTSVCFDLSVFELFVPLCLGGTVILAENVLALKNHPATEMVTLINTVPSAARELLRARAFPSSIRTVNLAGEPLPTELADQLYTETKVQKVYDLYGPTETTTYSTWVLRGKGSPPTIGRPLPGEKVYVLDSERQLVPVGMPGEIYIGGVGVARGYINKEALTAEKFVPDPFESGARLYRTGDLGRWLDGGSLEYLGRVDHQVKIRGFRIELGEIECALNEHPSVARSVVVCHEDASGAQQLVAYVVPKAEPAPASDLRTALERQLPAFMVPAAFVHVETIPLTPNGKIDRRSLPPPESLWENQTRSVVGPRNSTERAILEVWCAVLGRQEISIHDNFFHIGGHSLLAMQVASRLSTIREAEISLRTIFEAPTVASLSALLDSSSQIRQDDFPPLTRTVQPSERAQELLDHLDELSDEEVHELLAESELNRL